MNSNAKAARSFAIALAVFSGGYFLTLLVLLAGETRPAFVFAVAGYMLAVIVVQLLLVFGAGALGGGRLGVATATLFAAANVYSLYVVHMNLGTVGAVAITLVVSASFGLLLVATSARTVARLAGAAVLAVLPALSLVDTLGTDASLNGVAPDNKALLESYAGIRFRERPNIYLISFDAMIPMPAAQKLLGIDQLPYEDKLRELGATLVDDAFVSDAPSVESFDALMKLDDHWHFKGEGYFAGRQPSPVSQVFHANGYSIEAGGSIPFYFGGLGPNVDEHLYVAKNFISDSSLCKFATSLVRDYGVFGWCQLETLFETRYIFDRDVFEADPDAPYFDSHWHDAVLGRIAEAHPNEPRLRMYYYYYPIGHAANDFVSHDEAQLAAYSKRYAIQSVKAAEVIDEVYAAIRRVDPGAIVMIFGDHGTKISRTADWEAETEFWVQDNHMVLLALFGDTHSCGRPEMPDLYRGDGYVTVGRAFAAVIRCLAENPEDLDGIVRFIDKFDFSKYLIR